MSAFKQYLDHGWVLVPIKPGQKGPRTKGWNMRANCITDPAHEMRSAGLAHAYSGTCAIDVDDYDRAAEWLAERGIILDELFNAPTAVQITSGREGHGKLIYKLPEPLCSKKVALFDKNKSALDFRCATAAGLTVQDVLPPSIHPNTGRPYEWFYNDEMIADWRDLPMIPEELHAIWLSELEASARGDDIPERGASVEELRALLTYHDPDMNRDDWIRIGMAIHHESNGSIEGLDLWDEWSQGSDKYAGRRDLETCWRSFHDTPNAITVGSLRQSAVASPDDFPDMTEAPEEDDPWAAVQSANRARFAPVHVSEIAKREPPEWLVDRLLPRTELAMMFGAPRVGKSFAALDLAFAVATGGEWFEKKVLNPGPVVWIAAEAAGAMRNRARAYAQAKGVKLEETQLQVVEQSLSLMNNEDVVALSEALATIKPKLIVVDTLAAASAGANENSGEDMSAVLGNCRRLHAATGGLVLLVHHSGKDASRGARGWSGIFAAVRTEFELTNKLESPVRVIRVTKQSDGVEGDRLPFKLQIVPLDMEDDISSCVVEPMDPDILEGKAAGLGRNQKIVMKHLYLMAAQYGEAGIPVQDVYDAVLVEMPSPAEGKRDYRQRDTQRALIELQERGLVIVHNDHVKIGAEIYGTEE